MLDPLHTHLSKLFKGLACKVYGKRGQHLHVSPPEIRNITPRHPKLLKKKNISKSHRNKEIFDKK